jgi:hypothetical protein
MKAPLRHGKEYTTQEVQVLREFLIERMKQGMPLQGKNMYQEFAAQHPSRTGDSWRTYARKKLIPILEAEWKREMKENVRAQYNGSSSVVDGEEETFIAVN